MQTLTSLRPSKKTHQYHVTSWDVHVWVGRLFTPGGDAAPCGGADCLTAITELRWDTVDPGRDGLWALRRLDCHALPTEFLRREGGYRWITVACSSQDTWHTIGFEAPRQITDIIRRKKKNHSRYSFFALLYSREGKAMWQVKRIRQRICNRNNAIHICVITALNETVTLTEVESSVIDIAVLQIPHVVNIHYPTALFFSSETHQAFKPLCNTHIWCHQWVVKPLNFCRLAATYRWIFFFWISVIPKLVPSHMNECVCSKLSFDGKKRMHSPNLCQQIASWESQSCVSLKQNLINFVPFYGSCHYGLKNCGYAWLRVVLLMQFARINRCAKVKTTHQSQGGVSRCWQSCHFYSDHGYNRAHAEQLPLRRG